MPIQQNYSCRYGAALAGVSVFVAAAALPASAQQQKPAPKPAAPKPAPIAAAPPAVKLPANVVARVDSRNITADDLLATLQSFGGRPLIQQLIQGAVVEQEAKRLGVTVTPQELAAEVKKQKENAVQTQSRGGANMMTWSQIAARDGLSEGFVTWNVRLSLLARKTFEKSLDASIPGLDNQIKLAHILIPTMDLNFTGEPPKQLTEEEQKKKDEEAKAKATQILADIKAGKITFEDAAKQFSADKGPDGQGSASNGGALPWYGKGMLDPAFETAGWALQKPGDMTQEPVKSRFGYHIIKLIQLGKNAPAAEKAAYRKEQVNQQMQSPQTLQMWMGSLMQKAKITINPQPKISAAKPVSPAVRTSQN